MSVVVFQCSECDREIELVQQRKGLEVINNCIITQGCNGRLMQTKTYVDYSKGKLSEPVAGLTDWSQRKVLFNHTQSIEDTVWTVTHNLNCVPTFVTYVNKPKQDDPDYQEKMEPHDFKVISENIVQFTFLRPYSGIAQLLTNTTFPVIRKETTDTVTNKFQISNNAEITIGVLKELSAPTNISLNGVIFPAIGLPVPITMVIDNVQSINSPWRSNNNVLIKGNIYNIRSYNVRDNLIISNGSYLSISVDKPGQYMLLLSNEPRSIFDVVRDYLVDIYDLQTNPDAISFEGGELFVDTSKIKSVFPPAISV